MIEVKLSFANQAELLAFFAGTKPLVSADERTAVANITVDKAAKPGKPQPADTQTAAAGTAKGTTATESPFDPNSDKTQRIPREVIEEAKKSAAAQPAAAQQSAASTAASSDSASGIDYAVLQKAVFALAGKSRETMVELCAARGVKTFKELPPDQWPAALADVNAALAKLG